MSTLQDGAISGTVIDNDDTPLPGVTVTLTGVGAPHVQVTNYQGQFKFPSLQPGSYEVEAQLEGFTSVTEPITVNKDKTSNIVVTLQPEFE